MRFTHRLLSQITLALAVCAGVIGLQAFAFTEPSSAPPAGNVAAPINTGANSQDKTSWITADGLGSRYGALFATLSGSVGIGTVTPLEKLSVSSNGSGFPPVDGNELAQFAGAQPYLTVRNSSNIAALGSTDENSVPWVGSASNTGFDIRTNATARMTIDVSGSVGIGTASPAGKLDVEGGNLCLNGSCISAWPSGGSGAAITGGACPNGQYVYSLNSSGVPTCSTPSGIGQGTAVYLCPLEGDNSCGASSCHGLSTSASCTYFLPYGNTCLGQQTATCTPAGHLEP